MNGNPRERILRAAGRVVVATRRTRITARVEHDRGVFMISVAAELAEMHPQTLRMYEARGLIEPKRSPKGTRLYSQADVERLRRIQEMTTEWGMNLAGVERVFALEDQLERMQRKVSVLERRAEQLQEEIARLEEVRNSVKAEIVRYEAAPGTSLIPIRHVRRRDGRSPQRELQRGGQAVVRGLRDVGRRSGGRRSRGATRRRA